MPRLGDRWRSPIEMLDPYTPTTSAIESRIRRRAVWRYIALTSILLPIAAATSIPGITLLNQEYGWYPNESTIYEIEINGSPVSNESVIQYSIVITLTLLFTAILFSGIAIWNWLANKRTIEPTNAPFD
ncbi:MAG: hypothetical protein ACKO9Q_22995 [Pirellula sp.]